MKSLHMVNNSTLSFWRIVCRKIRMEVGRLYRMWNIQESGYGLSQMAK